MNVDSLINKIDQGLRNHYSEVLDHFIHYYGEDRVDITIKYSADIVNKEWLQANINNYIQKFKCDPNNLEGIASSFLEFKTLNDLNALEISEEDMDLFVNKFLIYFFDIRRIYADIIVWFPKVTITNENNKSIDIFDFYAKTGVNSSLALIDDVTFCKATYTIEQWNSNYIHSHISSLDTTRIADFKSSCLGTGPLSKTIPLLRVSVNKDLWPLFCLELDRYVARESLDGGPYKKLEYVTSRLRSYSEISIFDTLEEKYTRDPSILTASSPEMKDLFEEYIKYIIGNKLLDFVYRNNNFEIKGSPKDVIIKLSNAFIEYYNSIYLKEKVSTVVTVDVLKSQGILLYANVNNEATICYYYPEKTNASLNTNDGRYLFKFKNKDVNLKIINAPHAEVLPLLLNFTIISSIIKQLLLYVNNTYFYNSKNVSDGPTSDQNIGKAIRV